MALLPQVSHLAYASARTFYLILRVRLETGHNAVKSDVSVMLIGSILETGTGLPPLIGFTKK